MKYLIILFVFVALIAGIIALNQHGDSKPLQRTRFRLADDVQSIENQIAAVAMLKQRKPKNIEAAYSGFLADIISYNHDYGLEIRVRIRGVEDYQTISGSIQPSEIAGVRRVLFVLDSPSNLLATMKIIGKLQSRHPVLFHELQHEQRNTGVVFSLYGT